MTEDIAAYPQMALNPQMSRYTGSPASEGAVWRMFAFQVGHWALNGFGMWLAHDRTTGEFVGRDGKPRNIYAISRVEWEARDKPSAG